MGGVWGCRGGGEDDVLDSIRYIAGGQVRAWMKLSQPQSSICLSLLQSIIISVVRAHYESSVESSDYKYQSSRNLGEMECAWQTQYSVMPSFRAS